MHFGARAGWAGARRRDAGDAAVHRRGAATPQMPARRRAPSGCGSQARWLCCSLLTYQGVCSSLAPRQRTCEPAAKCTTYFLTDPYIHKLKKRPMTFRPHGTHNNDHENKWCRERLQVLRHDFQAAGRSPLRRGRRRLPLIPLSPYALIHSYGDVLPLTGS